MENRKWHDLNTQGLQDSAVWCETWQRFCSNVIAESNRERNLKIDQLLPKL